MYLRPNKIRFCQDSISSVFDKNSEHAYERIGETLDDLLRGDCDILDIPPITVVDVDGDWYTTDNRRLWVFQKLEDLGHCKKIPVIEDDYIPPWKFTTVNDGLTTYVRGNPGGDLWKSLDDDSDGSCSDDSSCVSSDDTSYDYESSDELTSEDEY
ncbi:uncharacterized protein LOC117330766 [Pecten maximus]|uniref:uncharacterized protein LOC117330766 n=1 Tax=Pecten maximus TaxID=6579 RepID=UPI001457F100|nr:uncharacterized protein LOC117330766 [Pecten maximus]